ncbi:MAG: dihydrofolate reductase family protein [Steroidobacteraceae bacterium]
MTRPLRYSVNVTLDGCCDHRVIPADDELHRHAIRNLNRADALLFGRVTYQMMEAAFRPPAQPGARPDWTEPFARTIDAATKYVVSSTLDRVDWIDEYEFVVHPRLAGHGPTLFAGLSQYVDLNLVSRLEFRSGAVAMRYEPRR